MRAQMTAMAIPCAKCGQLFDLSYDLRRYGAELSLEDVMSALSTKQTRRKALCWKCRTAR